MNSILYSLFFLKNTKITLESCYFSCHTTMNVLSTEAFPWNSQSCNDSGMWQGTETLLSALRQGRWDSLQPSEGEPTQPHVLVELDSSMSADSGCWEKKFLCGACKFSKLIPCKAWESTNLTTFRKGCCKILLLHAIFFFRWLILYLRWGAVKKVWNFLFLTEISNVWWNLMSMETSWRWASNR